MHQLSDILTIYLVVVFIWLVVASFALLSIVKRKDVGLPFKVFWCAVIISVPVVGLVIYLIYNNHRSGRV